MVTLSLTHKHRPGTAWVSIVVIYAPELSVQLTQQLFEPYITARNSPSLSKAGVNLR